MSDQFTEHEVVAVIIGALISAMLVDGWGLSVHVAVALTVAMYGLMRAVSGLGNLAMMAITERRRQ